ncbi:MAG: primosomal protein N' [Chloroflexi bacterium]|nr:primosomal protein N' [Chloroflexota bacterium]
MATDGDQETLGLPDAVADAGIAPVGSEERLVAIAIDAAGGAAGRPFTYRVPVRLEPLLPGEAVLLEFGRRQALGIVLGDAMAVAGVLPKPIVDRVRADGPLLPAASIALARDIASSYLAPPALVLRAMLPPGLLERLELVAERRPASEPEGQGPAADAGADDALLAQLDDGPRPVRRLRTPEGRAGLMRRLRTLRDAGRIDLDWTLYDTGPGPRYVRIVHLVAGASDGRGGAVERGAPVAARRLGVRQVAALADLAIAGDVGIPAPELSARHGGSVVGSLHARSLITIDVAETARLPLGTRGPGRRGARPEASALSPEQRAAVEAIETAIAGADPQPILLDGVTGGGKTAIYAAAIATCLAAGGRALILVPEIALAVPLVDRLRADVGAEIGMIHSGLSDGERLDEWRRIRAGAVDVVVGTRLAVVAPIGDLKLIVVDEEHDPAYKSDRTPRLQARDTAIRLARLAGAAIVLGSATPAVESEGRARDGTYRRFRLTDRLSGGPPTIEIVDLRAEMAAGQRGMLSRTLVEAIRGLDRDARDQAILVINRRGSASVVMCRDCGAAQRCAECTRPLVYHQAGVTLRCHHCGRATPLATRCPSCGSARIRYLGGGTERLEREVRAMFPDLRVARLDRDVVERKGAATKILDDLADGRIDVLVGTSLVTKGIDVPTITLVGIVSADVALNLPDERAAERTYQLLSQAVGRAGRGVRPGRAILQTYQPDHPAVRAVEDSDPATFYDAELALRRQFGSPPFGRLVKLTVAMADREAAEATADAFAEALRRKAMERGERVDVVGPAIAYIARRADRWRFNVVLRGRDPLSLLGDGPGAPWSVDVDPESLL